MKKAVYIALFALVLSGCGGKSHYKLGFTPVGLPITLSINNNGIPSIEFNGTIKTPIGSFALSYDNYINPYRTYIELVSKNDNKKYIFELTEVGEKVSWVTTKSTKSTVEHRAFSTIVTVESEEISEVLHKRQSPKTKPDFPEQSFSYYYLTKKLTGSVNWEVNNVKDFFADAFYGIVLILCVIVDSVITLCSFVIRFFWWLILLLAYLVGFW